MSDDKPTGFYIVRLLPIRGPAWETVSPERRLEGLLKDAVRRRGFRATRVYEAHRATPAEEAP